jgi:dTDP-glucose 4,6-dehydratase
MKILVTGGYGFIGSCFIRTALNESECSIINIDNLTYAAKKNSLRSVEDNPNYTFLEISINDRKNVLSAMEEHLPDYVVNFAAETHVDNSIDDPSPFIQTNINGTYNLLECSRDYWQRLRRKNPFKFVQVSTDEVYGSLGSKGVFSEESRYQPNSPYSASKAAGDHLVRAWCQTFGLPTVVTNCSNNFGIFQDSEKFIPMIISNAINRRPITIYGRGLQIRDWLSVEDHVRGLLKVLVLGKPGETYLFGGENERRNIDVAQEICQAMDALYPPDKLGLKSYADLIVYVDDRLGHDYRYAVDFSKSSRELDWFPSSSFAQALETTIRFYVDASAGEVPK